jgi:hypothetical protein
MADIPLLAPVEEAVELAILPAVGALITKIKINLSHQTNIRATHTVLHRTPCLGTG